MKTQKNSGISKHSAALKALGSVALLSATVGANSKCVFCFHDPQKPEALKKLKKF